MALTLSQIQATTNDYWENQTTDIFFRESILLYRLMGSGKMDLNMITGSDLVDGGQKIREFLEYGRSNVSTYGNRSTIDASKRDIINAARFDWSGYVASNTIDLTDRRENSGKAAMVNLVYAKMENIRKSVRDYMGAGIYVARSSSPDSYGFDGLPDLFNTTTSVAYGSIAEDDMSDWKANVDTDSEAISYEVLQKLFRAATVGQSSDGKPNQIVTTQTLLDAYKASLQVQQRFVGQSIKMAEAGFQNVLHDGVPMVYDTNQSSGVIDCLNLKYLRIRTHPDFNFTKPVWESSHLEPDTLTANCRFSGALTCSNRKAQSRGTGKTA